MVVVVVVVRPKHPCVVVVVVVVTGNLVRTCVVVVVVGKNGKLTTLVPALLALTTAQRSYTAKFADCGEEKAEFQKTWLLYQT